MSKKVNLLFLFPFFLATSAFANTDSCRQVWNDILSQGDLPELYQPLEGLCGDDFRRELRSIISTNKDLGYKNARSVFFSKLDNVDGEVCGVYTGKCIRTSGIPDSNVMNCEHSWPQSKGATGIAKSDLNHLFPADSRMNSVRSNYPLCNVEHASYEAYGSSLGNSKYGTKCFEPQILHKGDVARAMMYFSVRYGKSIDSEQEEFFREWNELDPVSEKELKRNDGVEKYQNNRNPFIDFPQFSLLIDNF